MKRLVPWLIVASSLALALIVAEAAFRILLKDRPGGGGWGWAGSPYRAAVPPRTDAPNQLGARGQPIAYAETDLVVLLVGDSQVEAAASQAQDMPERLLEQMLVARTGRSVKVFSLAAAGWGQDQQLIALAAYFSRYRANVVVLWATPGNDFWENAFPVYGTTSAIGPLKPTYRWNGTSLEGPFFAQRFLYGSALIEALALAWSRLTGIPLEARVLDRWTAGLPSPDRPLGAASGKDCASTTAIDQNRFGYELFQLSDRYTLVTREDFAASRSHFSPYVRPESARDRYLLDLSRSLYREIDALVRANGAAFRVFYPVREDFDVRFATHAVCVAGSDGLRYPLRLDYRRTLDSVLAPGLLDAFALEGRDDIVVSPGDRHLNRLGNERVMSHVAGVIADTLARSANSAATKAANRAVVR